VEEHQKGARDTEPRVPRQHLRRRSSPGSKHGQHARPPAHKLQLIKIQEFIQFVFQELQSEVPNRSSTANERLTGEYAEGLMSVAATVLSKRISRSTSKIGKIGHRRITRFDKQDHMFW
jgi:hypothetical protein